MIHRLMLSSPKTFTSRICDYAVLHNERKAGDQIQDFIISEDDSRLLDGFGEMTWTQKVSGRGVMRDQRRRGGKPEILPQLVKKYFN